MECFSVCVLVSDIRMSKPVEVEKLGADSPLDSTGELLLTATESKTHTIKYVTLSSSLFPLPPTQIQSGMDLNQITRYISIM